MAKRLNLVQPRIIAPLTAFVDRCSGAKNRSFISICCINSAFREKITHVDATSCLNTSELAGIQAKNTLFNFCNILAPIVFPDSL
jgi:hypothetical protein